MIFLGAGASAQFNIPTSTKLTEFFNEMLQEKHSELMHDFRKYHYTSYKEYPNFEHIMRLLLTLSRYYVVEEYDYLIGFMNNFEKYIKDYSDTIDLLRKKIVEFCSNPFEKSNNNALSPFELDKKFKLTYDPLFCLYLKHNGGVQIFTTNYDPSIELWSQKRNIIINDGSQPMENPEIRKLISRDDHYKIFNDNKDINLIRLHGSVWERKGKGIKFWRPKSNLLFSDDYDQILNLQPDLIFPGEEVLISKGQNYILYNFLRENIQSNCLFIGYSFSHSDIREAIISKLSGGGIRKIGILTKNPENIIKKIDPNNKYIRDQIIIPLKGEFGKTSGMEALREWFNQTNDVDDKFSSLEVLSRETEKWMSSRRRY